jgi:hypothetical protein
MTRAWRGERLAHAFGHGRRATVKVRSQRDTDGGVPLWVTDQEVEMNARTGGIGIIGVIVIVVVVLLVLGVISL